MLDLSEVERGALVELLRETIETTRYPLSPRVKALKAVLAKMEPVAPPVAPYPPLKATGRPSLVLHKKRRR